MFEEFLAVWVYLGSVWVPPSMFRTALGPVNTPLSFIQQGGRCLLFIEGPRRRFRDFALSKKKTCLYYSLNFIVIVNPVRQVTLSKGACSEMWINVLTYRKGFSFHPELFEIFLEKKVEKT